MIGAEIKKMRTQNGMTQKQLADKLFVSPQAVSRWENNEVEPSISIIKKLADIFEVTTDEILGLEVKENKPEKPKPKAAEKKPVNKPVVTRQFLAVCELCNRPIYNSADIVRKDGKVFCVSCNKIKEESHKKYISDKARQKRTLSYIFGSAASVIGLIVTLYLWDSLLISPTMKAGAIIYSLSLFTFVSCCFLSNNFVGDLFLEISSWSIRMPGLIVTLDLDGCIWFLGMRALFAVIGFLIGALSFAAGLTIGCAVSIFVYPYAIVTSYRYPEKSVDFV